MKNFKDVTFIIPILIDSDSRLNNFRRTIQYIQRNLETNIIVLECDRESHEKELKKCALYDFKYIFKYDESGIFHKTKILNEMMEMADTNIVVQHDIDTIVKIEQYLDAKELIKGGSGFVLPYDDYTYNINQKHWEYIENDDLDAINVNKCKKFSKEVSIGGIVFFDKKKYGMIGYDNENFISWGYEDDEKIERINKMGYSVDRVPGKLYHQFHTRGNNSSFRNKFISNNREEYYKICSMTREELEEYIKKWEWNPSNK